MVARHVYCPASEVFSEEKNSDREYIVSEILLSTDGTLIVFRPSDTNDVLTLSLIHTIAGVTISLSMTSTVQVMLYSSPGLAIPVVIMFIIGDGIAIRKRYGKCLLYDYVHFMTPLHNNIQCKWNEIQSTLYSNSSASIS